jgi:hypothetical protein
MSTLLALIAMTHFSETLETIPTMVLAHNEIGRGKSTIAGNASWIRRRKGGLARQFPGSGVRNWRRSGNSALSRIR